MFKAQKTEGMPPVFEAQQTSAPGLARLEATKRIRV